jgi:hypothetical protein
MIIKKKILDKLNYQELLNLLLKETSPYMREKILDRMVFLNKKELEVLEQYSEEHEKDVQRNNDDMPENPPMKPLQSRPRDPWSIPPNPSLKIDMPANFLDNPLDNQVDRFVYSSYGYQPLNGEPRLERYVANETATKSNCHKDSSHITYNTDHDASRYSAYHPRKIEEELLHPSLCRVVQNFSEPHNSDPSSGPKIDIDKLVEEKPSNNLDNKLNKIRTLQRRIKKEQ